MDLRILFPILTMMYTGFLHTVSPARVNAQSLDSTAATRTERHARTKRCSCATFLDKECVYFCHLDIIWVNTPERVVSYGLGNTPRRRRATRDPSVTKRDPRCACVREEDSTCADFCQLEQNLRSAAAPDAVNAAAPDAVIPAARGDGYAHGQRGHALAAKTGRIRRVRGGGRGAELTAALRSRLLLRNWRGRGGGAGQGPGRTRGPWPRESGR